MPLAEILQNKYNSDNYRSLLNQLFGVKFKALATPDSLPVDTQFAKFAHLLGEITLSSGETIAVFEVSLQNNIQIEQNKVGIRNLLRKYWNKYDGAFIASYKPIETRWRFSFVSETRQFNEDGDYEKVATAAKRYTYLIGESQACRTANERLSKLNSHSTLAKIIEAFSVETLTKQFYKELFAWYEWALSDKDGFAVTFPNDTSTESDDRKIDEHIIRLITRLMFVWFIKQKSLIPNSIFDVKELKRILKTFDPSSKKEGNYYNAILQNLFFATLNKPINERAFANEGSHGERKEHYGVKTLFRNPKDNSWFNVSNQEVLEVFKSVPFLNGGLFECLDKENEKGKVMYYDGFSREAGRQCRAFLPNCLFFDETKGLIPLLNKYNFTIEENTPTDIEVALDPELLGKVFENLLGAYNPETKETARKQSGSFYTPREIVNYMVDESLIAYLCNSCGDIAEQTIRDLFAQEELPTELQNNLPKCHEIAETLQLAKIIDPACGSGAFPMGVLNRMVDILKKLHEEGECSTFDLKLHLIKNCIFGVDIQTIAVQISKLRFFISLICEQSRNEKIDDNYGITPLPNLETKFVAANTLISTNSNSKGILDLNDTTLSELKDNLWETRQQHFYAKNADEKKKLRKQDEALREKIKAYLVQNASKPNEAFIQTCSSRIEKLKNERNEYLTENWVDETEKQVAQISLFEDTVKKEPSIFRVDANKKKRDEIDSNIKELEKLIDKENKKSRNSEFEEEVEKLVLWNPYDQNTSSLFFDPEWMFGLSKENEQLNQQNTGYFDVVIGNPPYGAKLTTEDKNRYKILYTESQFKIDTYSLFVLHSTKILKNKGFCTFIIPNTLLDNYFEENVRKLLLIENRISEICDLNDKVFDSVVVHAMIFSYTKEKTTQNYQIRINTTPNLTCQNVSYIPKSFFEKQDKYIFSIRSHESDTFIDKLKVGSKNLFDVLDIRQAIKSGDDKLYIGNERINESYKPILRGKDVFKYAIVNPNKYIYYGKHLACPRSKEIFEQPKILIREAGAIITATYDDSGFYIMSSLYNAIIKDNTFNLKYILALINSKLFQYLMNQLTFEKTKGAFTKAKIYHYYNLPIRKTANQQAVIKLVDEILITKKLNPQQDTSELELKIDELVYDLYNLSDEEIKIINLHP